MKGFGVFCLIVGLVLLAAGFGIQYFVDHHEEIEKVNATLVLANQEKISPEFVSALLNGKAQFMGMNFTVESLLKDFNVENADQILLAMRIYSYTPLMVKAGAGLAVFGLLITILAPGRKKRYSYSA